MANNFDTIKTKSSSEKFNLVRLEHSRAIEGDLTLQAGTIYTATYEFSNMHKLEVDGTSYTKVASNPASGEFSFNEDTRLVTVHLAAALTTQMVVVSDYLFFTNGKFRITNQTPTDSNTTVRKWEPRIEIPPSFDFNLRDISEGCL